jgi:F-type H+-transporting ATPase subunit b
MPQFDQVLTTYASQIFWLLLTFGITFVVVGYGMYPKIQGTADARDKKISDDLETARAANTAADEAEEAYRVKINKDRAAAQTLVAEAKAKAAKDAEKKIAKVDAEVAEKLAAAETELAAQRTAAMAEVEAAATEAAQDIVAKLSGTKVTKAAVAKQVKAELANA